MVISRPVVRSSLATLFVIAGFAAAGCDTVFGLDRPEGNTDAVAGACPSGFETSKHQLFLDPKDWTTAEAACVALSTQSGGRFTHLAVAETQGEWVDLANLRDNDEVWVGASDRKEEGVFRWVTDQSAEPIPWGTTGEPDGGEAGDCVKLADNAMPRPDDADCTQLHAYVCECDRSAEQPANF